MLRSSPPPPPLRNPSPSLTAPPALATEEVVTSAPAIAPPASTSTATLAARPSVVPKAPATPPPPPQRQQTVSTAPRLPSQQPSLSSSAQLEQRLGQTQIELRKLGTERHTLRARLRREADRVSELESALRAEQELRRQAGEQHQLALNGLRTRLAELEAELAERSRVARELELAQAALPSASASASAAPGPAKVLQGLRRIRGIGPAYQRALEGLGVSRVEQIAVWTPADVAAFAEKLKVRRERIEKDDWVAQAKALGPED